jgi:hypothetical protein
MAEFPWMIANLPQGIPARKVWLFTVFCVEYVSRHIPKRARRRWRVFPRAADAIVYGAESRPPDVWADYAHQLGLGIIALSAYLEKRVPIRHGSMKRPKPPDAQRLLSDVLSDILGSPHQPAVARAEWLTWNDGAVRKIAETIYQGRAFDHMPILADALEESGCNDQDMILHCRGFVRCNVCSGTGIMPDGSVFWEPGSACDRCASSANPMTGWCRLNTPHVLGCWVIDLLTGRS